MLPFFKIMKKSILSLIILIISVQASAQTRGYVVYGTVLSQQDNTSLPGANVMLTRTSDDTTTGAATDLEGNFTIQHVPPGNYILTNN